MKPLPIHEELKTNELIMKTFFTDCHNTEMEKNIGKEVIFIKPDCTIEKSRHTIVSLQRNYKGDICYRVHLSSRLKTDFGRVADPKNIIILPTRGRK